MELQNIRQGQKFPAIYTSERIPFRLGNQTSGAAGAVARASFALNTHPGSVYGIRISNVYEIPNNPTAEMIALFDLFHRVTDWQQTVEFEVAQQTMTLNSAAYQTHISGNSYFWYEFPEEFGPLQGGNNIAVTVRRATSYPTFSDGETTFSIEPEMIVSLWGKSLVDGMPPAAMRRGS